MRILHFADLHLGVETYGKTDPHTGLSTRLLDFLRAIPQDAVTFELKDQKSAGEMRPAADGSADQYRYVVMPMRI